MKKTIVYFVISIVVALVFVFFIHTLKQDYNKYGQEFNSQRRKLGISEIPHSFYTADEPNNLLKNSEVYSLEYISPDNIDSGLFKKRIDVDENSIGIIREYSYFKKGSDTLVEIHNYYK